MYSLGAIKGKINMRIMSLEIKKNINGLLPFPMKDLGRFVVLAGENGSGKTRLLKVIEKITRAKKDQKPCNESDFFDVVYADDNGNYIDDIKELSISNYSHSDLPLQSTKNFPPYVINKSKENLEKEGSTFEQTAEETLLYLTWLAKYAEPGEMEKFNNNYCEPLLGYSLKQLDDKSREPLLFNHKISNLSDAPLSPGQKYLLRLCVALNCNIIPPGAILFFDEPESHLHPKALLKLFDKLMNNFSLGQIWIATHSIELISHFWHSDVWYMTNGEAKMMGSNTEGILKGVLGDETKRYHLYQFISSPDTFVSNAFAVECLCGPKVLQHAKTNDASVSLACAAIQKNEIVVDFGAGKGRFLESYFLRSDRPEIRYYAYDKYGFAKDAVTEKCLADYCKLIMEKNGIPPENYYGSEERFEDLVSIIPAKANKILLINVLHEIAPSQWMDTFRKISRLLRNDGSLIIVERKELTVGEKPSDSGFFVMQHESLSVLFACEPVEIKCCYHEKNEKVFACIIPKQLIDRISIETIKNTIDKTKEIALNRIKEINELKNSTPSWEEGIALAFWMHQFMNAYLFNPDSLNTDCD